MCKNQLLATAFLTGLLALPAAAHADRYQVFGGVDSGPDSLYGYVGGVMAVDAQQGLANDGWLVRFDAGLGTSDYETPAVTGAKVDDDFQSGTVSIGYQIHADGNRWSVYLGPTVENHDTSPNDPRNSVNGSEWGIEGQAEWVATLSEKAKMVVMGSYASAFDTYWSRANIGYSFGWASVGPEIALMGNEEYDQRRFGGFVGVPFDSFSAHLSGGYASTRGRGDNGPYFGLSLATQF